MRPGERGVSHDGFCPQPDRKRAALRAVWSRSRGSASRWTASPPRGAPRLARRCGAPAHVAPGCMPSMSFLAKHLVGVSCVAVLGVPGREVYYLYMASIVGKRQGNATYYY